MSCLEPSVVDIDCQDILLWALAMTEHYWWAKHFKVSILSCHFKHVIYEQKVDFFIRKATCLGVQFLVAVHCDITGWYMTIVMSLNRSIYPFTPERPRDLSARTPEPAPSGVLILRRAHRSPSLKTSQDTKCQGYAKWFRGYVGRKFPR